MGPFYRDDDMLFEFTAESASPSICNAPGEDSWSDRTAVEHSSGVSQSRASSKIEAVQFGTERATAASFLGGALHGSRLVGVRFQTLSRYKLVERTRRRCTQTAETTSNLGRGRRSWQQLASLSLLHGPNDSSKLSKPSQNLKPSQHESPFPPEPAHERRKASSIAPEKAPTLLQNLAKISIPWLRSTRLSAAQSRAIMRNIPLLERAGLGAVAGGLAGGFTNATLHPIDTVKTKLQAKGGTALYTGAWDVVRKVLAKQGIRGFYRGLPAAVVGSVPSSAVYFGTYELGKELLLRVPHFSENRLAVPPFAAAIGNLASSAFLVPKEVVKQRLQTGASGTAGAVFLSIVREQGFKGLYAGYSAALLRNVPSNVISFSTFEYLKAAWLAGSSEAELQPWQSLFSGAVAGMLSAAATTPLDVVKTRLMTEARQAVSLTGATGKVAEAVAKAQFVSAFTPSGAVSTLRQISAEEGFKGLVRGAGPRILYGGCFSAMGFLSFETAKRVLLERYLRAKERERKEHEECLESGRATSEIDSLGTSKVVEEVSKPRTREVFDLHSRK